MYDISRRSYVSGFAPELEAERFIVNACVEMLSFFGSERANNVDCAIALQYSRIRLLFLHPDGYACHNASDLVKILTPLQP
jgi:hypothetical protein